MIMLGAVQKEFKMINEKIETRINRFRKSASQFDFRFSDGHNSSIELTSENIKASIKISQSLRIST